MHADISHDGTRLAFGFIPTQDTGAPIYVSNTDGTKVHPVGTCTQSDCIGYDRPAWSPNGTRLVITHDFGPPQDMMPIANGVAILDAATGTIHLVTKHDQATGQDVHPRWSPDGRSIVFWRDRAASDGTEEEAIFIVRRDGTGLRQLTPWDEDAGDADWSPDGTKLVYSTHSFRIDWHRHLESELVTIHPDGSGRAILTDFGPTGPRGWRSALDARRPGDPLHARERAVGGCVLSSDLGDRGGWRRRFAGVDRQIHLRQPDDRAVRERAVARGDGRRARPTIRPPRLRAAAPSNLPTPLPDRVEARVLVLR